ncbi:MAG: hypothetical protein DRQ49_02775 [Gammaproteobacteria bacterium]|nr:MAG: hypothetical protein DRQ41_09770 [Gammaproteobacteria bacterium]RKZ42189.1 MAG: hypothetical protein DRQ49_02775 [Gammaproteobacteria bacterium]RKZ74940.1 MAG: hypothetical protein DRQ57_09265 [Gammaproteobacteria bacterium]
MLNVTTFGNIMRKNTLPDWEQVLSSAARLQRILPQAVLVGGTASAIYAQHRFSRDADHVLVDLKSRFEDILAELESVAGWKTARIQRPVQILGNLDGIETGIRQLIRHEPLETKVINYHGKMLSIPTEAEILRIKGILILKRNATRDYLDFVALADHLGNEPVVKALERFNSLYPQENGESPLQQLQAQLANALPFDLDEVKQTLSEYKGLDPKWHDWECVKMTCANLATAIFDSC